jgi:SNF2 family DNA or RNA helicase
MDYIEYLEKKRQMGSNSGFEPNFIPDYLFYFQKSLVNWAIHKGRGALFEDCGLGKTIQELVWAKNICNHTNGKVLILTPLAVSHQTKREADKFGIDAVTSFDGLIKSEIVITNYEKLCKFNPSDFKAVVTDESSCLKNFDSAHKAEITNFMLKIPYRLLGTATAAPNDYIELGTSSEALGYIGFMDMLNKYFKNTNNDSGMKKMYGEAPKWRFKGHSELPFWRWVTFWARACRKPSDLGFNDEDFKLTPFTEKEHLVETKEMRPGFLFNVPARTLLDQRDEKKRTIKDRCEKVLEIVSDHNDQSVIWCQYNEEGETLKKMIPDSIEISGKDSDDKKEKAFLDFANGNIKRLITKPKIGAFGMNWQNCAHIVYFPSHSYEQYYQAIRRCWRFGQKNQVTIDIVLTESERKIMQNLQHKSIQANNMFTNLVNEMNNSLELQKQNEFTKKEIIPTWL